MYLLTKGVDNIDRETINEWTAIRQIREAKGTVPKVVAVTWLDLHQRGCLPSWCVAQIDIGMFQKAAL